MLTRRRTLKVVTGMAALALPVVRAQNATTKLLVGFAPGGSVDQTARALAERLRPLLNRQIVVENRPGAAGRIIIEATRQAAPNGDTLMLVPHGPMTLFPWIHRQLRYDPFKDFTPIQLSVSNFLALVVHPSVPAKSLPELVALAKKSPGKLNAGSGGNGSANHLAIEMLKLAANISVTHVPYRSGGPSIAALVSGETDFSFSGAVTALPQIRSGKVRALAVTSTKRTSVMPDLPTIASFYPGYDSANWYAMFVPAATPAAIISKLHTETVTALKTPEIRDFMVGEGADVVGGTPAELGAYLKREIERYSGIIKSARIKGD